MSFSVNHLIGFGVGSSASPPTSLSYRATTVTGADSTNYTFTAADIGTAAANRKVIVAAWADSNSATPRTHDALAVGGVSSNLVATVSSVATAACVISLWELDLATGDTADIVLTTSGANVRCGIAVWAAYGCEQSAARDTATSVADPADLSVDTLEGGFVVACVGATHGSGITVAWTGLTERSDEIVEAATNTRISAADSSGLSPATPLTISGDYSATPTRSTGVAAAWR